MRLNMMTGIGFNDCFMVIFFAIMLVAALLVSYYLGRSDGQLRIFKRIKKLRSKENIKDIDELIKRLNNGDM